METPKDRIALLTALGQSLWLDSLSRQMIENGQLAAMIERGDIRGITSNPTIFNQAIGKSKDYDSALMPLAWAGWDAERIFWQLAIEDIKAACDLFRPLYDGTAGGDGYVSLEVSPRYAHDTRATTEQVKELWSSVGRPNLMVKIPATPEGIPAIRGCIAAGININVTLIFSLQRYDEVMDAYLSGLEERAQLGEGLGGIASVASFFVSRVDTKVDGQLPENSPLRGRAGIANAKLAYRRFQDFLGRPRFSRLQEAYGARIQRPLWASTSTKNPAYPDTLYADGLIGPDTVDTIPPHTLEAFRDHGTPQITLKSDLEGAVRIIAELEAEGIHMTQVTQELEDEGVASFSASFDELLDTIDMRRQGNVSQLADLARPVTERIAGLEAQSAAARLHNGDPTLWTAEPAEQAEIRDRLGWLDVTSRSRALVQEASVFASQIQDAGFEDALLLGMGGSSLAPEVLSLMFGGSRQGGTRAGIRLSILDSTDPDQILEIEGGLDLHKTLMILSSKSGGTAEVMALFNYFWDRTQAAGGQWIAITDPGTSLDKLAIDKGFRRVFRADPQVGGRYSALTAFGLAPAEIMGIDATRLLDRAAWMAAQCGPDLPAARNPGLALGALLGEATLRGRDKLTLIADELFEPFGPWVEQLVAESSGKRGKGIFPIIDEPLGTPEVYGNDRLFVYLRSEGQHDMALKALREAGHPVVVLPISDPYDFGSECYRWEVAISIACSILGINAFDQPDVQDSKDRTKAKIAAYLRDGHFEGPKPFREIGDVSAFSPQARNGGDLRGILSDFFLEARAGDFIAINAYLPRDWAMTAMLSEMRVALRNRTGCATALGFGPRFLHSTGQLHKGGPPNALFLQITREGAAELEVPNQGITFGVLQQAQALGDYEALIARNRRVLRIHLRTQSSLAQLAEAIK